MAQLGDLARAKELLANAARAFGDKEPMARARCNVAEAEIALVSRDLGRSMDGLGAARSTPCLPRSTGGRTDRRQETGLAIKRAFDLKGGHEPGDLTREQLLGKVTRREGQVLELLTQGHPNKVVAYKLGIAENTVEVHRHRLMRRLEVRNFAELMRLAVRAGI